jgi:simple sugar transport system substrate-binding protein
MPMTKQEGNRMNKGIFSSLRTTTALALAAAALAVSAGAANADALRDKWCSKVHLRFFVGGAEGDAFGTIVYNGAVQAAKDTGAQVDYVFSGWASEKMTQQLREAVAAHPDGIAMMGHPGEAAILPLAQEADKAGIKMMYQNVPVPAAVAKFGGGYVGAQQGPQGTALGVEAVRRFGLKAGETAIVIGGFDDSIRAARELGTAEALEKAGLKVIRLNSLVEWAADPNLAIPVITAAFQANPDAKLIVYPGGQNLGNAPAYMKAAGKKPGEVINIGFDTSPQVIEAFKGGWVQLTADQQPFQQGYLPILSLCETIVYGLAPLNVDTGAGFVTTDNYQAVASLATEGLR